MISPTFRVTGDEARGLLYGLLEMDRIQLREHPEYPSVRQLVREGRIRYREADPDEHWQTYRELVEAVEAYGVAYGDCEDLATAVAAEDHERMGVASEPYAYSPRTGLFHVVTSVPSSDAARFGGMSAWPAAMGASPPPGRVLHDISAAAGMQVSPVGVRGKYGALGSGRVAGSLFRSFLEGAGVPGSPEGIARIFGEQVRGRLLDLGGETSGVDEGTSGDSGEEETFGRLPSGTVAVSIRVETKGTFARPWFVGELEDVVHGVKYAYPDLEITVAPLPPSSVEVFMAGDPVSLDAVRSRILKWILEMRKPEDGAVWVRAYAKDWSVLTQVSIPETAWLEQRYGSVSTLDAALQSWAERRGLSFVALGPYRWQISGQPQRPIRRQEVEELGRFGGRYGLPGQFSVREIPGSRPRAFEVIVDPSPRSVGEGVEADPALFEDSSGDVLARKLEVAYGGLAESAARETLQALGSTPPAGALRRRDLGSATAADVLLRHRYGFACPR